MIVQPVVQVSMRPLVRKARSSTNQQIRAGGSSQRRVPSTQSSKQQHHTIEDDEDEDLETELSDAESRHKPQSKRKARKFRNEDLPGLPKTGAPFRDIVIPRWIFYFSALDSPWKLANSEHVTHVQKIWDQTFPDVPCMVALHDKPIFTLVRLFFCPTLILTHFKDKQRTYDWRRDLSLHALKAIEAFFDRYENFTTAVAQADYVKWVVPAAKEFITPRGDSIPIAPPLLPYMWASVEDGLKGVVSCQSSEQS